MSNKIEKILKDNGLSVTEARKIILEIFLGTNKPLNINDFKKKKSLASVNESSIYRNLKKLEEASIIHSIPGSGDFQSFEMIKKGHHHHHISCSKCQKIQCLTACELGKILKSMAEKVGFQLTNHSVELVGLCKNCY